MWCDYLLMCLPELIQIFFPEAYKYARAHIFPGSEKLAGKEL